MLKSLIQNGLALTANTDIPLTLAYSTNNKLSLVGNNIAVNRKGYYKVNVNMTLTNASASPLTVQLFVDGVAIPEAISSNNITATTGIHTFMISDILRFVPAPSQTAKISLRIIGGTATTAGTGVITVEAVM